jgi:hypothetical protein
MPKVGYILMIVCYFSTNTHAQSKPMSCIITGQIVSVMNPIKTAGNSIWRKYPCKAIVRIASIDECGSSVTLMPQIGDTVEINFGFSLTNTRKSLPTMKQHYPGLKRGNIFRAQMEQRIRPGGKNQFVVYHYSLK